MARQCTMCGAVYEHDDAEYCNACGSEVLVPVVEASPARPGPAGRLRDDPYSLAVAAVLWISGLVYILGQRQPRTWALLIFSWGVLSIMGLVAGLMLKNVRTATAFAGFGAIFVLLYGLVKLT